MSSPFWRRSAGARHPGILRCSAVPKKAAGLRQRSRPNSAPDRLRPALDAIGGLTAKRPPAPPAAGAIAFEGKTELGVESRTPAPSIYPPSSVQGIAFRFSDLSVAV